MIAIKVVVQPRNSIRTYVVNSFGKRALLAMYMYAAVTIQTDSQAGTPGNKPVVEVWPHLISMPQTVACQ